jgi:type VI secretion system secreted protein Hcp
MAELVLDVPTIPGECTTVGYEKKISVTSMSFSSEIELEITTTNATRTMHTIKIGDIELNRPFDVASVPLIDAMIAGRSLGTVKIYILKPTGEADGAATTSQKTYMTYTLYDTMVKSHSFNADDGGAPTETIGLNFTKVLWDYNTQMNDAKLKGHLNTGYNLLRGKKDVSAGAPMS